jgi:hypothetical protein
MMTFGLQKIKVLKTGHENTGEKLKKTAESQAIDWTI